MAIPPPPPGNNVINGTGVSDNIYGTNGGDTIYGGDGNDTLRGFGGGDWLYGGDGNDSLQGHGGGNVLYGGDGNDTYFLLEPGDIVVEGANGGTDRVVSYLHSYTLGANVELLTLRGDAVYGAGNDLNNGIQGSESNNVLSGAGGNDSVYGNGGDDLLFGGAGNDLIDGGTGTDLVSYIDIAGAVSVSLATGKATGSGGNDTLRNIENIEGSKFHDTLIGDAVANKIDGDIGNDTIRGGAGDDDLIGGAGQDTFVFESTATNGLDIIRAFSSADDTLQFKVADGYSATAVFTNGAAATTAGPEFFFNSANYTLSYDADGTGIGAAVALAVFLPDFGVDVSDIVIV